MRLADVSQLPVLVDGQTLVGVIDESDILLGLHHDAADFSMTVASAMTNTLHTLAPAPAWPNCRPSWIVAWSPSLPTLQAFMA